MSARGASHPLALPPHRGWQTGVPLAVLRTLGRVCCGVAVTASLSCVAALGFAWAQGEITPGFVALMSPYPLALIGLSLGVGHLCRRRLR